MQAELLIMKVSNSDCWGKETFLYYGMVTVAFITRLMLTKEVLKISFNHDNL